MSTCPTSPTVFPPERPRESCMTDDYSPYYDDEHTFTFDEMGRLQRATCPPSMAEAST